MTERFVAMRQLLDPSAVFESHLSVEGVNARCAVAHDPGRTLIPDERKGCFDTSIAAAAGTSAGAWPSSVAAALRKAITVGDGRARWLLFAAFAVEGSTLHVCSAGDIRVHLVAQDGFVKNVTRDDVIAEEEDSWIVATYGGLEAKELPGMLTRSISMDARPPISTSWEMEKGDCVLVCTSSVHSFRDPMTYASTVLTSLRAGSQEGTFHEDEGFVAALADIGPPSER